MRVVSRASARFIAGTMVVSRRASIDFPAPGGPRRRTLWSECLHDLQFDHWLSLVWRMTSLIEPHETSMARPARSPGSLPSRPEVAGPRGQRATGITDRHCPSLNGRHRACRAEKAPPPQPITQCLPCLSPSVPGLYVKTRAAVVAMNHEWRSQLECTRASHNGRQRTLNPSRLHYPKNVRMVYRSRQVHPEASFPCLKTGHARILLSVSARYDIEADTDVL